MKYAAILKNDIINGEGICVSFWTQGCPHHCSECHNVSSWDFNGGKEAEPGDLIQEVLNAISANGIQRNLSVLGGEPLCQQNINFVCQLLEAAKKRYPNIKTFVWTGYLLEQLDKTKLINIDVLIDGLYDKTQRDVSLKLKGSKNQRILYKNIDF